MKNISILFLLFCLSCSTTNPRLIKPRKIASDKYQGMECSKIMLQRMSYVSKIDSLNEYLIQLRSEEQGCFALAFGLIITIPLFPICYIIGTRGDKDAEEQLAKNKGELEAIDRAIASCKKDKEIKINNNINIKNNN